MSPSGKRKGSVPCPCGGAELTTCCGRFLNSTAPAQTALELMRSRFSAYALQNEAYLQTTWHSSTRPTGRLLDDNEQIKWLSLEIRMHEQDTDSSATVEFVARYKVQGRAHTLHEISRFVREDGRWLYLDGSFPASS